MPQSSPRRPRPASLAPLAALASLALGLAACADPTPSAPSAAVDAPSLSRGGEGGGDARIRYGKPVKVGNGHARSYVVLEDDRRGRPLEVGVALDERALDGLPAPMPAGDDMAGHGNMHEYLLALPKDNPTPYRFVELDWNPAGHEPAGVYDAPHFDFHFYTISVAERNAIDPADPRYGAAAANLPAAPFRAPFYADPVTLSGGAPAAAVAVPRMGMHWLDVRSPELQLLAGNPAGYKPFTKTFINGSWDGAFIFGEPMITRAYILAKRAATDPAVRDEVVPVPTAARYSPAGYYPSAYRIAYDGRAKEYRVALTDLSYRR